MITRQCPTQSHATSDNGHHGMDVELQLGCIEALRREVEPASCFYPRDNMDYPQLFFD